MSGHSCLLYLTCAVVSPPREHRQHGGSASQQPRRAAVVCAEDPSSCFSFLPCRDTRLEQHTRVTDTQPDIQKQYNVVAFDLLLTVTPQTVTNSGSGVSSSLQTPCWSAAALVRETTQEMKGGAA